MLPNVENSCPIVVNFDFRIFKASVILVELTKVIKFQGALKNIMKCKNYAVFKTKNLQTYTKFF